MFGFKMFGQRGLGAMRKPVTDVSSGGLPKAVHDGSQSNEANGVPLGCLDWNTTNGSGRGKEKTDANAEENRRGSHAHHPQQLETRAEETECDQTVQELVLDGEQTTDVGCRGGTSG